MEPAISVIVVIPQTVDTKEVLQEFTAALTVVTWRHELTAVSEGSLSAELFHRAAYEWVAVADYRLASLVDSIPKLIARLQGKSGVVETQEPGGRRLTVCQKSLLASYRGVLSNESIIAIARLAHQEVITVRMHRVRASALRSKRAALTTMSGITPTKLAQYFRLAKGHTYVAGATTDDGFHYKSKHYVTHNTIKIAETAVQRLTQPQIIAWLSAAVLLAASFVYDWHLTIVVLVAALTILYFCNLLFDLLLIYRSYFHYTEVRVSQKQLASRQDWPKYTVFCPLYKEVAVLPQFIAAMRKLDYPADKLEVMLLLEADDTETIKAAQRMDLPAFLQIVVVPHSMPKTKPKACNYGLRYATGEYAVIYDAEDIPDPEQLKKAVIAFAESTERVGCVQAKLNYYNWDQNILTRLFTLEYSLWFDLILTGLQSIKAPIPLGGTSNHFRTKDLQSFGGWDPFNVTEDADLGIRLTKRGYSTLILDSTTMEEANSQYGNWVRQRSRWIKGYIQTYFVHTRNVRHQLKRENRRHFAIFHLVVGGKVLSALINPVLWLLTILYFAQRVHFGPFVHELFPTPIFYIGLITLVFGNFLYMYYYMMGAARRNHPELIPFALLVPLYWLMISRAAFKALVEFIVKPFHWQKTTHGLHLLHEQKQQTKAARRKELS